MQSFGRTMTWQILESGDDQFVLHRVLPADQFRDPYLIAVGLQLQAAQYVGELAAEFAGMQGVAPDFGERALS